MRTLIVYSLFQIPGLAVVGAILYAGWSFGWISLPVAGVLFGTWLFKDVVLYPFVAPAYESMLAKSAAPSGAAALIGLAGETVQPVSMDASGFVRVRGELWQARSETEIPAGSKVIVRDVDGRVLIVSFAE